MELPSENIKQAVHALIKENGFISYKIEVFPGCEKGSNFAGIVYKVVVTGMNKFDENITKHLFCKTGILNKKAREEYGLNRFYLREIKIYDEVLTEMKKFEYEKNINSAFTSFVKCICVDKTEDQEFLIMEDLTKHNFVMLTKDFTMELVHAELVMKAIGKFHALSFALRDQKPTLFQQFANDMPDEYFNRNRGIAKYNNNFLDSAISNLVFKGVYKEKWEDFYKNFHKFSVECTNGILAEPYSVICHGDMWRNNMMFKYENGVPADVCLFDWQIARYCSPVLDLVHYLFCCVDRSFRNLHYNTLLNMYYDSLRNFLKELGSNPEKLFPYSAFQDQLKKFGKFGLVKAIVLIPISYNDCKDVNFVEKLESSAAHLTNNQKTVSKVTAMLEDVVEEMVELGYL